NAGFFKDEIVSISVPQRRGDPIIFDTDEHPRATSMEALAKLKAIVRPDGTTTVGNASGVNDGAAVAFLANKQMVGRCGVTLIVIVRPDGTITACHASGVNDGAAVALLANKQMVERFGLTPKARVVAMATAGVAPRIMGIGPVPATRKVLDIAGLTLDQMDVIELNEAFAAQGLACMRELGLKDDDPRVNPNGGAIALGHPLGASGARLVATAINQLHKTNGRYALCTMCIGVGQGVALIIERV